MKHLGIDIGGTKIILAVLENQKLVAWHKIPTPKSRSALLKALAEETAKIAGPAKLANIGLSVAGVLNQEKTKVLKSPNLKYLNGWALAKILEQKLGAEIKMENDAKCFALAEALLGWGKNKSLVLGITLGSGIGAGFITTPLRPIQQVQGKQAQGKLPTIYKGAWGNGFEAGHHIIKAEGVKCHCGNKGCWEAYGAKPFFQRLKLKPKALAEQAKQGNAKALKIYQEYGYYVGLGLANLVNIIEPEIIVLGGGLSKAWPYFLPQAVKTAKANIVSPIAKTKLKIKISRLGEPAGAMGAALLASE